MSTTEDETRIRCSLFTVRCSLFMPSLIGYAGAKVLRLGVVREPAELVLHRLGQLRVEHDTVRRRLGRELGVKVGYVQDGFLSIQIRSVIEKRTRRKRHGRKEREKRERETYDAWLKRRLDLLRQQAIPVYMSRKERVPLDLVRAIVAQAPRGVTLQEARHEAARLLRDVRREEERIAQDALVHCVDVLIVEWWEPGLSG